MNKLPVAMWEDQYDGTLHILVVLSSEDQVRSALYPVDAVLPSRYKHPTNVNFDNRRLKSQSTASSTLSATKKGPHGAAIKYSAQFRQNSLRLVSKGSKTICKQRSRTKSSVTSLKKKSSFSKELPLKNTAYHYSTYQNVALNGTSKKHASQDGPIMNGAKSANRHNSFIASVEKHPRSYAEMIADYSKMLYKESAPGPRNDSLYLNNAVRTSPFSTFTTSPSAEKIVNIAERNGAAPCEERKDDSFLPTAAVRSDRGIRRDDTSISDDFQCGTHATHAAATNTSADQNCITGDDRSYVRLVADCGKTMHNISSSTVSNHLGGLTPERSVLAKNSPESFAAPARKASGTNAQEASRRTIPLIAATPLEKNINEQTTNSKEDWSGDVESVMSDLKSLADGKNAEAHGARKLEKNDISQLADERSGDSLQNGARRLAELIETYERRKGDTIERKLDDEFDKIGKIEKLSKDFDPRNNHSPLNDKTPNLPQYFSNATNNASVKKYSTRVPAVGSGGTSKQPQVKLRMVPSEKESIVSINVDSASSAGVLDPQNTASKQLSVVVQSDRRGDPTENSQRNVPALQRSSKSAASRRSGDFGPMRISISEDSAPIKQIEFSINGKPVSELKSITARTEKLDVVSSVDKIEIRIPFAKDEANTLSKSAENDLSKGADPSAEQILNVQISASFQNKFAKSGVEEPAETINAIPTSSSQIPRSHYVFDKAPAKAHDKTLSVNELKASGTGPEAEKSKKTMNTVRSPETTAYDKSESSDSRLPSKIIPWWSSSDSFNKIKKREGDRKPLEPLSNRSEKKTSNLNKNLAAESSVSREAPPGSKIPTKKVPQSITNEIVAKNNSDNLISRSNSSERCIESKPNLRYSCLFGLKPNRESPDVIPEIMERDVKIYNNQSLVESNDKVSEIKRTKPIAVSTSDTISVQGKHKVEDKAPTLPRKLKAPGSAQDSRARGNREKKCHDSPKQTKSAIDDIFATKPKIENNSDVTKPIKKKKDEDVKVAAKLSTRLNSEIKKVQNPPNFSNSLKFVQTSQNQETILQTNSKSSSKSNADRPASSPSLRTPLGMRRNSEQIGTPIALNQNKPNNLSNIKNTPETIRKLENLIVPNDNSAKEFTPHKKVTDQEQSPLEAVNETETKSKARSNVSIKDSASKNIEEILSANQSAGKLSEKSNAEIAPAKITTQNLESKSLLPKDCQENRSRESKAKDRGSFSGPIGFLKKPNASAGFVSSDSKMHTKSRVTPNDAYARKLLVESSRSDSDELSDSQRAAFRISRNLSNVDDALERHRAPSVIGKNATPWTDMDRPEKSMLYSAWLQRSKTILIRNDVDKKEKLH